MPSASHETALTCGRHFSFDALRDTHRMGLSECFSFDGGFGPAVRKNSPSTWLTVKLTHFSMPTWVTYFEQINLRNPFC